MDVYIGDGDVVKMDCKETGDRKNPNMHEWVLKSDADRAIESLESRVAELEMRLSRCREWPPLDSGRYLRQPI